MISSLACDPDHYMQNLEDLSVIVKKKQKKKKVERTLMSGMKILCEGHLLLR